MNSARLSSFGSIPTTSRPLTSTSTVAGFVVCQVPSAVWPGMNSSAIQDIYRVAYERALGASRPSLFELAMKISLN